MPTCIAAMGAGPILGPPLVRATPRRVCAHAHIGHCCFVGGIHIPGIGDAISSVSTDWRHRLRWGLWVNLSDRSARVERVNDRNRHIEDRPRAGVRALARDPHREQSRCKLRHLSRGHHQLPKRLSGRARVGTGCMGAPQCLSAMRRQPSRHPQPATDMDPDRRGSLAVPTHPGQPLLWSRQHPPRTHHLQHHEHRPHRHYQ